jgi:hypothetical protein
MKKTKLRHFIIYLSSILLLFMVACLTLVPAKGNVATQNPAVILTTAPMPFELTVVKLPVKVTHGSTVLDLEIGQTQQIFPNDIIDVGVGGYSQLLYSDKFTIEIMQGAELVVGGITTQTGSRIEAILSLNKGHLRVIIGENAKADVILITQDSQVATLSDGTAYSVCYRPGSAGLTCVLVEKGSIEVRDKTTGKTQIYPPLMAGYTFNGKAPQPPVCIHADEYQNWLSKMRSGVTVETLGTMVGRWITEPCSYEATTPTP